MNDASFIFAEKNPANVYKPNLNIQKNIVPLQIWNGLNKCQSERGELAKTLNVKVNSRTMITVNLNSEARLINGQLGTI